MSDTAGKVKYFALNLLKRIALTISWPYFVVVHYDLSYNVLCHYLVSFQWIVKGKMSFFILHKSVALNIKNSLLKMQTNNSIKHSRENRGKHKQKILYFIPAKFCITKLRCLLQS